MRIGPGDPFRMRQVDLAQQVDRAAVPPGGIEEAVRPERLGDLVADAHHRVERGHGFLEDRPDVPPAHPAPLRFGQGQQVRGAKPDGPGQDLDAVRQEPDGGKSGQGLARPRFAHHAEHLARHDRQRHVLDGMPAVRQPRQAEGQVLDRQNRGWTGHRGSSCDRPAAGREEHPPHAGGGVNRRGARETTITPRWSGSSMRCSRARERRSAPGSPAGAAAPVRHLLFGFRDTWPIPFVKVYPSCRLIAVLQRTMRSSDLPRRALRHTSGENRDTSIGFLSAYTEIFAQYRSDPMCVILPELGPVDAIRELVIASPALTNSVNGRQDGRKRPSDTGVRPARATGQMIRCRVPDRRAGPPPSRGEKTHDQRLHDHRRRTAPGRSHPRPLRTLRSRLRGKACLADEAGYHEARTVWNAMIDRSPEVAVRCAGAADVMNAVDFARRHDLVLSVKGGGHNIAGNAVSDGGVLLDLGAMNVRPCRSRDAPRLGRAGCAPARRRPGDPDLRPRRSHGHQFDDGDRGPDARRRLRMDLAPLRDDHRQPRVGRRRAGGRQPRPRLPQRTPGPVLGAAGRRRQLRRGDEFRVQAQCHGTAGHRRPRRASVRRCAGDPAGLSRDRGRARPTS